MKKKRASRGRKRKKSLRQERLILRSIPVLRDREGSFTSKRLMQYNRTRKISDRAVRRLFNRNVKNVHKKVLSFVSSRRFGKNPFIGRMFQPLSQNQTFTVHTRQMMHMLFETCAREELKKLELYVMFMPLGASILSLKITLLSSRRLGAVPLFTCLTTDTFMSWVLLWSTRLKCSATGKPPPW